MDMNADEQDRAEMFDEESRGEDETMVDGPDPTDGHLHGRIGAPDQLGSDDIAELVGVEEPAEDDLSPEEAAMHFEDH